MKPRVAPAGDGWRLLMDRGAGTIEHPGGTLGAHLRRTAERLAAYGVDEDLVVAGRCHAAYGTAGFPVALLTLDERDLLRERIGPHAEALVHEYCSCDRRLTYPGIGDAAPLMHDRWSGEAHPLPPDRAAAFCNLTVANELDIADQGYDYGTERDRFFGILRSMGPHLIAAARDDIEATEARTAPG